MPRRGGLRQNQSPLSVLLRVGDAAVIAGTLSAAVFAYDELVSVQPWQDIYTAAAVLAVVVYSLAAQGVGLYRTWRTEPLRSELVKVTLAWVWVIPALLLLAFLSKTTSLFSRGITTTWFIGAPCVIALWRGAVRLYLRQARKRGRHVRQTAVVGMTSLGERVAREIQASPALGMSVLGFFDDREPERCHPMPATLGEYAGTMNDLVEAARAGRVDTICVALPLRAETRIADLLRALGDTTASVYMAADFYAFDLLHARWSAFGDVPVVSIHDTPFYGVGGWLKRLEDIVVGSLILLLISVPMVIIAIGVKLSSPGPVFFRQRRYGLNGEVIDVLKFRSMRVMEDGEVVQQATKEDPRVTRFGRFIRRTSLDELPQFLHVLTGQMSIVGPRPHAVAHNELYRKKIQGYMLRHKVKPGITGWAQVNGWRGETDTLDKMEQRVAHDLEYIRNWGLLWDLQIIFLTVFGRRTRHNAY